MLNVSQFTDEKNGLAPTQLMLRDYMADKIVDGELAKSTKTIEKFTRRDDGGWIDSENTLSMRAAMTQAQSRRQISINVQNLTLTQQVSRLDIRLPAMTFPSSIDNRIYTGYRGGSFGVLGITDWKQGQGNSGSWPGYCTSPLVTIYDEKTNDTVAITFFNDQLRRVTMYWFSGPAGANNELQAFNPCLRFDGNLEPGESINLTVEISETTGGPSAHWADYRQRYLQPFMARFGFPESATFAASGIWGGDQGSGPGLALKVRQLASTYKIEGYIAWPSADGQTILFDPHLVRLPFFSEFLEASQTPGLKHFGTLVIPDASPRIASDPALAQKIRPWDNRRPYVGAASVLMLNQRSDFVRQYNLMYAKLLRDHGVTVAYYDVGGGPHYDRPPLDWLRTFADFRRAGIAIMAETGADVATWITGVWMEYPYSWSDYKMLKALLPGAALFAFMQEVDRRKDISCWRDAENKGVIPIMKPDLLKQRVIEQAINQHK